MIRGSELQTMNIVETFGKCYMNVKKDDKIYRVDVEKVVNAFINDLEFNVVEKRKHSYLELREIEDLEIVFNQGSVK